jgi:hypothetical protein
VRSVDDHAANYSGQAKPDDAPIKSRRAAPARFPPVHPLAEVGVFPLDENRRRGLQKILFGCEEVVVGKQHAATQPFRSEIDEFGEVHENLPQKGTKSTKGNTTA